MFNLLFSIHNLNLKFKVNTVCVQVFVNVL